MYIYMLAQLDNDDGDDYNFFVNVTLCINKT